MQSSGTIIQRIVDLIINPLLLVLMALAFLLFVYGLVEFLWNLNEGGENSEGKRHMVWGIVGLLIMISVYGIVALIDNTFGFGALSGQGPNVNSINIGGTGNTFH